MKKLLLVLLTVFELWGQHYAYEVRWDGTLCTLSGGSDRRILRKAPVQGACHFPIPIQKRCLISAVSNAKTALYDGDKIILTPLYSGEAALADLWCESGR